MERASVPAADSGSAPRDGAAADATPAAAPDATVDTAPDATADTAAGEIRGYAIVCAISGAVFAALIIASMVLLLQAPGLADPDSVYVAFYADGGDVLVTVGMHLVPFAGIAWLWHMTATRNLVEAHPGPPSKLPFGLHLASGILFVAMMFASAATVGAPALLGVFTTLPPPSAEVARSLAGVGYAFAFVYGVRAAGMYMMTMSSTMRATGLLPRWLVVLGYVAATFLLVNTTYHPSTLLVFPTWVIVVCATLVFRALRR